MKYKILLFTLLLFLLQSGFCFADSTKNVFPDKIKVEMVGEKKEESNNMPWIAAIIVGLLTVGANILISQRNTRTTLGALKQQLDRQDEIVDKQFHMKLKLENKQKWLDDFKKIVSEYHSNIGVFHAHILLYPHVFNKGIPAEEVNTFFKLWFNYSSSKAAVALHVLYNKEDRKSSFATAISDIDIHIKGLLKETIIDDGEKFSNLEHKIVMGAIIIVGERTKEIENLEKEKVK